MPAIDIVTRCLVVVRNLSQGHGYHQQQSAELERHLLAKDRQQILFLKIMCSKVTPLAWRIDSLVTTLDVVGNRAPVDAVAATSAPLSFLTRLHVTLLVIHLYHLHFRPQEPAFSFALQRYHVPRCHRRHRSPYRRHSVAVFLLRGRAPHRDHHHHQHTLASGVAGRAPTLDA